MESSTLNFPSSYRVWRRSDFNLVCDECRFQLLHMASSYTLCRSMLDSPSPRQSERFSTPPQLTRKTIFCNEGFIMRDVKSF